MHSSSRPERRGAVLCALVPQRPPCPWLRVIIGISTLQVSLHMPRALTLRIAHAVTLTFAVTLTLPACQPKWGRRNMLVGICPPNT